MCIINSREDPHYVKFSRHILKDSHGVSAFVIIKHIKCFIQNLHRIIDRYIIHKK